MASRPNRECRTDCRCASVATQPSENVPCTRSLSNGLVPFLLRRCPDPRTIAVDRIIVHEFGNFVSWPMLDEEIGRFQHAMKPYWLTPAREKMNAIGLLSENQVRLDV